MMDCCRAGVSDAMSAGTSSSSSSSPAFKGTCRRKHARLSRACLSHFETPTHVFPTVSLGSRALFHGGRELHVGRHHERRLCRTERKRYPKDIQRYQNDIYRYAACVSPVRGHISRAPSRSPGACECHTQKSVGRCLRYVGKRRSNVSRALARTSQNALPPCPNR